MLNRDLNHIKFDIKGMGLRVISKCCRSRRDAVLDQQRAEERGALSFFLKEFLYWGGL